MDQPVQTLAPHVLIFPFPVQGHVNSMLKLAELLCLADFHVTFLIPDDTHDSLLRHTDVHKRFEHYARFRFQTISDGIPADRARSDGVMSFAIDLAEEMGIPIIYFRTISACSFWAYFCIPELIEAGELPFKGNDLDVTIQSIPGMEGFLRRRDLPSICRVGDLSNHDLQLISSETRQTTRPRGLILNTFEDLEGPILSHIRTQMPNQTNSRFVGDVWKLGLDIKDICDRVIVAKMIKDLMEVRRDEFMRSVDRIANLATQSIREGGSSYCNLDRLIEDIRSMGLGA
ncbi:7-deoxyloganetic acid glucosyltransferase [Camellia lanceoleosa]|uniref:7-deoxyloganetic acid glucosyltransferase n=1 Tax=Camellia lanceoleosa TaxID=1840588 RepID=A0ACC0IWI9_9ERIC|nr:7-deoxyloganetic acid glucosyltransferase [Camellia lanceoleosa]